MSARHLHKKAAPALQQNARQQALSILLSVLKDGAALDDAFHRAKLAEKDAPFIKALCFGVLRDLGQLRALLKLMLTKPLKSDQIQIEILLYIGLYQLISMTVKEHAAVSETVEVAKKIRAAWAVPLINATLRRFLREREALLARLKPEDHYSHPAWLLQALQEAYPKAWRDIIAQNNQQPPMTLRVNAQKASGDDYRAMLDPDACLAAGSGRRTALILQTPVNVNDLPGFADGFVSVQDLGAQYAAGLMDLKPNLRVLDACAAPGGKSAHMLETCPDIDLTAMDISLERLKKIEDNFKRLTLKAKVIQGDATTIQLKDTPLFDRILIDAPCSGTGVIRRHPDIKWLRRESDIATLAATQGNMLTHLWPMLAVGGILIYCTCSVLPAENDAVIEAFVKAHQDVKCETLQFEHGLKTTFGWQFLPRAEGEDGFYYAKLINVSST